MTDAVRAIILGGATASGKTATALRLAREFNGELIGADSVQVYRGFDIGSAKPTTEELDGIPHHLIDVIDPTEKIDAADFSARADAAVQDVHERGKVPIVVGGTGLWIRTWHRGLFDAPKVDPALRSRLEDEVKALGNDAMHQRLKRVDPEAAESLHPNDSLRVVRALEIHEQTGRKMSALQAEHAQGAPRHNALFVVMETKTDDLPSKIESRMHQMLQNGWLDEVKAIVDRWGRQIRPLGSVGYREVLQHLQGATDEAEMRKEITRSTRVYARRQRTWFNGESEVQLRITADDEGLKLLRSSVSEHLGA